MSRQVILHAPHASRNIPDKVRKGIVIDNKSLKKELDVITDHYTDKIALRADERSGYCSDIHINNYSRLVVDVSRLPDDREELNGHGLGLIHTKTHDLRDLRETNCPLLVPDYYLPYSQDFSSHVTDLLLKFDEVTILNIHSYSSVRLPFEGGGADRPEISIGTSDKTPEWLIRLSEKCFDGYSIDFNTPFSGTYIPLDQLGNERISAVNINIRRDMYMHERKLKINYPLFNNVVDSLAELVIETMLN